MIAEQKFILDACCGGRMFWFNKQHPNALYIDNRTANAGHIGKYMPGHAVEPDMVMDFRKLDIPDRAFKLVVFDPPHFVSCSPKSVIRKKYGVLDKKFWRNDLKQGFDECWRVLDDYGILIFKWSDYELKLAEVLEAFGRIPLFGHTTGSNSKTHWMCFMKIPGEKRESPQTKN